MPVFGCEPESAPCGWMRWCARGLGQRAAPDSHLNLLPSAAGPDSAKKLHPAASTGLLRAPPGSSGLFRAPVGPLGPDYSSGLLSKPVEKQMSGCHRAYECAHTLSPRHPARQHPSVCRGHPSRRAQPTRAPLPHRYLANAAER
uniref:Uncharacterized protein n=1 Tax=Knipowitschia caucasica TaxID=637954 RepID=A0AAV2JM54_KNICA